ncbi:MAG: aspartate aminotransferase family protein [Candidatus Cybelea sp.]
MSPVPGPRSATLAQRLRRYEQRNVTFLAEDFPVFWESASGATVIDVDGNEYIDCTAAFGVANVGHCNPRVTAAVASQAACLTHGMGDVHPTELRVRLFERLITILPQGLDRFFLATTGSEAIEAALKTAILATGKSRFAAYRGGYHGLSLGALAVGGIERFRAPFASVLGREPLLLEFPRSRDASDGKRAAKQAREALGAERDLAALVIEPIQGRAGCIVPPPGYLAALRAVCDDAGIIMIADEIFTGFGRTGDWFAVNPDRIVPDILCIGKAMGSGVPISAAIGKAATMDAWPLSAGEALHTSTFLGNPLGCAAALATLDEMERLGLPARAQRIGERLGLRLDGLRGESGVVDVRGRGLLWGIALRDAATAFAVVRGALANGVILLQSGVAGDTIGISPPLTIEESQLDRAVEVLETAIRKGASHAL